ncbi:hypothetical protein CRYUN_Cryun15aG0097600 [Craigia yunnanensis]
MSGNGALEEAKVPLIEDLASAERLKAEQDDHNQSLTEGWRWQVHLKHYVAKPLEPRSTTCWQYTCNVHIYLLLPLYLFASPVLELLGQPKDVAELSGIVSMWMIPLNFSFAFQFPLQRFLQSQLKNIVIAWVSLVALLVHVFVSWLLVYRLQLGVVGTAITLNFSWWVLVFGHFAYTFCCGCPLTWTGFSMEAFSGLWEFIKLSAASGVMLWYYLFLSLSKANYIALTSC